MTLEEGVVKRALLIGLLLLAGIVLVFGKPSEDHDWISSHADGYTFMEVNGDGMTRPPYFRYCFDLCLKHGDLKPVPCK